ncbi:hypothetical protein AAIB33_10895 [Microbacterium sp. AZCO]|uniref:hypothetical protein n=1 Tax=Microbacterium sp. AZCO TaxID=3142976 RepID=UPI0031F461C5
MKHRMLAGMVLAAALLIAPFGVAAASAAPPTGNVCADYSTGHIDPGPGVKQVTYTAPAGQVILAVCVKAGSAKQGLRPEAVTVPAGATRITFSHSSGKDIGHYSVLLGADPLACIEGWVDIDTRLNGRYECVETGLHVWTTDNSSQAKVSLGTVASFPLSQAGPLDLDWTGTTPAPGLNLFVNFGNGQTGTLVWEAAYGGDDLWLTQSGIDKGIEAPVVGGGSGSSHHGTLAQWSALYPNAQVYGIAFSLGSGVLGDGVIHAISAGGTVYDF